MCEVKALATSKNTKPSLFRLIFVVVRFPGRCRCATHLHCDVCPQEALFYRPSPSQSASLGVTVLCLSPPQLLPSSSGSFAIPFSSSTDL
ncbi:hypothetical protein RJT34_24948 [Clitoria ternatea]|uniref:Uncharacterized protein n=1 Tax=Clitoria ternatea TaxID=43366 RepID=A0AAN9FQX8_CLITE